MFPADVFGFSKPAVRGRFVLSVFTALSMLGAQVASANAAALQCPPDVFSVDYERYIKTMDERFGYRLNPQVYGTHEAMTKLVEEFGKQAPPPVGSKVMAIYFTDINASQFMEARCAGDCSEADHDALAGRCAMEMGSTCLDFAVVIDGIAQCLMIPRPKL